MSKRKNPPMPAAEFGLLLVEGGDEESVCRVLAGPAWSGLCVWKVAGRDFPGLARLAVNDSNFRFARSIGLVLDAENNVEEAESLAAETLRVLGASGPVVHGELNGTPRIGAFLTPDGTSPGSIETLCRRAVRDARFATCVDEMLRCAGMPHTALGNARAAEDKGWLRAYLGMTSEPDLRFYQAFEHPRGLDSTHAAFASLRAFVLAL